MLAEVAPEPLRLDADDGTTDRTTQETRSGSTSQHMFLNLVRSKRYDELSLGTPLRFDRTGHRPEGGGIGQRTDPRPFRYVVSRAVRSPVACLRCQRANPQETLKSRRTTAFAFFSTGQKKSFLTSSPHRGV